MKIKSFQKQLEYPQFDLYQGIFYQSVWNRYSIRRFQKKFISVEDFWNIILQKAAKPKQTENIEEISVDSVFHRLEVRLPGSYQEKYLFQTSYLSDKVSDTKSASAFIILLSSGTGAATQDFFA
ncbi:MAG: hypothetical protein ACREPR_19960 [Brasilonema sp.]